MIRVWEEEKMPQNWSKAWISSILKKGDKQKCENYTGIALLNTYYKILTKLIGEMLNEYGKGN